MDLRNKRIVVTGGSGFLGRHLVQRLRGAGCDKVFVPRSAEFDLTQENDIRRLLTQQRPEVVIHLAAVVGGIGANRDNPGRFFYENLIMGAQLIEHGRRAGVEQVRRGRHHLLATRSSRRSRSGKTTCGTATRRRRTRPTAWPRRCCSCRSQAYRQQYGFNGVYLLPVNLYGPRDNFDPANVARHPGADPQVRRGPRARRPRASTVWGTGTPTPRVPLRRGRRRGHRRWPRRRYDGPEPVNLGSGEEISIAELVRADRRRRPASRARSAWTPASPTASRAAVSTRRGPRQLFGFQTEVRLSEGLDRTIAWYESSLKSAHGHAA